MTGKDDIIIDDLQVSLRHHGVDVQDVELIGDYLRGESEQFPRTLLRRSNVNARVQRFVRDYPDTEAGKRAAWLFHT